MKKKLLILMISVFLVGGFLSFAQEEMEDPVLILPTIELEVEDLSVEQIEADLPDEAALIPLDREIILPEDPEVEIGELDLTPVVNEGDFMVPEINSDSPFGAEALLGVGNVNALEGRLSFYKLGDTPRYGFDFHHKALDGFGFKQQGQGFSIREDIIKTEVKLQGKSVETEFSGSFSDIEQGLQGQGTYYSRINRFVNADLKVSFDLLDSLIFYTQGAFNLSSFSLTGDTPPVYSGFAYPASEFILNPEIGLEFLMDNWNLGLAIPYSFRYVPGSEGFDLHRFQPGLSLNIQTPGWLNLSAQVSYFLNHHLTMLVPFEVSLGGSPLTDFSFRIWGGLENQENNLSNLWKDNAYSDLLIALEDNHKWYGHGMAQFYVTQDFRFSLTAGLAYNSALYNISEVQSPDTALLLYDVLRNVLDLEANSTLRWKLTEWVSFNILADFLIYFTSPLKLNTNLTGELLFTDPKGNWNVSTSVEAQVHEFSLYYLPVWDVSASFRVAENIIINGACEDILFPFLENPRYEIYPFITPGIRGSLSVQINF